MPAVTPPYIPRFGAGAPVGLAAQGTIYYQTDAQYTPWIFNNGGWQRASYIYEGAGAPAGFAPDGALYSRPGQAAGSRLYQASNGLAAPTVVQSAHGDAHSTHGGPTMGGAVTQGNLLLAAVNWNSDLTAEVILANWSILQSSNDGSSGSPTQALLYRYAQAGDGTTPPDFFTGAANPFWGWDCLEISGVTGAINTDIVSHTITPGDQFTSIVTPHQSTTTANQLALLFLSAYNGSAAFALPAGYTQVDSWFNSPNFGCMMTAKQTPANGTDIGNLAIARPAGANASYYASQLILAAAQVTTWTAIA